MPSSSLYQLVHRRRFTLDVFRGLIDERAKIIVKLFRSHTPPANLEHYGLFWRPGLSAMAVPFSTLQGTNWLSNIGPADSAQKLLSALRGVVGPLDNNWPEWPSRPPSSGTRRYWILSDNGTWLRLHIIINDPEWRSGTRETWATIRIDALPIDEAITSFNEGRRIWRELGRTAQVFLERAEYRLTSTRESVGQLRDGEALVEMLADQAPD